MVETSLTYKISSRSRIILVDKRQLTTNEKDLSDNFS